MSELFHDTFGILQRDADHSDLPDLKKRLLSEISVISLKIDRDIDALEEHLNVDRDSLLEEINTLVKQAPKAVLLAKHRTELAEETLKKHTDAYLLFVESHISLCHVDSIDNLRI